ncbi:hypothetical protein [Paucihalobacter ruber]|uniref:hypothetical protein n=1 Tax=Paucihalobacter ruber TaxID=2567861 RepID=UPI001C1F0057|nr:hypothetical protein [Paucihalobacter ruber]
MIVIVWLLAHCPASGVNVYSVVVELSNAGDHVPVIPFSEVVGKTDIVSPWHMAGLCVKVGVVAGLTVIVIVWVRAHWPVSGVKVYSVVVELSNAGDHVPVIPFSEVVGNGDKVSPSHMADTCVKVGVVAGLTVIVIVWILAHWPVSGVNVYSVVVVSSKAGDHVPEIPFSEVVGNGDKVSPSHMADTCVKVGVVAGLTVIVIVWILAHWPVSGVNVYSVVVVLSKAGDHVPVIPFSEVVGNGDKVSPWHMAGICVKVGVVAGLTVIVIVWVRAHWPVSGVKVYSVVVELSNAGDHVPVIPFSEVVGNGDKVSPSHMAGLCVKVGVVAGLTVIVIVWVLAHCPASGVNVYSVVVVLSKAGDHVPVIPFSEVVGRALSASPSHMAGTCVKVGDTSGTSSTETVTVIVYS